MLKTASRLLAVTACLMGLFLTGCGDDTGIFIDNGKPENGAEAPKTGINAGSDAEKEEPATDEKPTADNQNKSWWKKVFNKDDEPAEKAAGNPDEEEFYEEEEVTITHQERWKDPADAQADPDFEFAMEKIKEVNYPQAKHYLLNVVKRQPNSSSAWRWLGECHYNMMELEEAINAFEKSLSIYPENYFAMRGEGFARTHYGHELWRNGKRDAAHDQYRQAMKLLQDCTRIYPGDLEAMYGRSMAAEGASRRLYQNAIILLRQGKRQQAEAEASNCVKVIDEGIDAARQRIYKNADEIGPRNIAGGLFQRRAMLQKAFGRLDEAVKNMQSAVDAYESIQKIDADNYLAGAELTKCKALLKKWETELDNQPAQP